MTRKSQTISSMDELMHVLPEIFKRTNEDPAFGLRFAANPLMATEELGFSLTDELQRFATKRVRFSTKTFERLQKLEQQIQEAAGERFDVDSAEAVSSVLFEKLNLPHPQAIPVKPRQGKERLMSEKSRQESGEKLVERVKLTAPLPARIIGHAQIADPLEPLRGIHPILKPLLEYRQLEASSPRLASRDLYERIKLGKTNLLVTRVQFHWKPKK